MDAFVGALTPCLLASWLSRRPQIGARHLLYWMCRIRCGWIRVGQQYDGPAMTGNAHSNIKCLEIPGNNPPLSELTSAVTAKYHKPHKVCSHSPFRHPRTGTCRPLPLHIPQVHKADRLPLQAGVVASHSNQLQTGKETNWLSCGFVWGPHLQYFLQPTLHIIPWKENLSGAAAIRMLLRQIMLQGCSPSPGQVLHTSICAVHKDPALHNPWHRLLHRT